MVRPIAGDTPNTNINPTGLMAGLVLCIVLSSLVLMYASITYRDRKTGTTSVSPTPSPGDTCQLQTDGGVSVLTVDGPASRLIDLTMNDATDVIRSVPISEGGVLTRDITGMANLPSGPAGWHLGSDGTDLAWELNLPLQLLANSLLANTTGSSAQPDSFVLDRGALFTQTGGALVNIAPGTTGQFLSTDGTLLTWVPPQTFPTAAESFLAVSDTNVTLTLGGSPLVSLLAETTITASWTGQLSVARGGTNLSTCLVGSIPYASSAGVLASLSGNTSASTVRHLRQTSLVPAWDTFIAGDITSSFLVPVSKGGTGLAVAASGDMLYASDATTIVNLAKNPSATTMLLWSVGNGTTGAAPFWDTIQPSDYPNMGTLSVSTISSSTSPNNLVLTLSGTPVGSIRVSQNIRIDQVFEFQVYQGGTGLGKSPSGFHDGGMMFGSSTFNPNFFEVLNPPSIGSQRFFIFEQGNGTTASFPFWNVLSSSYFPAGVALTATSDTNVTITLGGTPSTSLITATSLTAVWSGLLAVPRGGMGITGYTIGDLIYADTTSSLAKLSDVATGSWLNLASTVPIWTTQPTIGTLTITGTPSVIADPFILTTDRGTTRMGYVSSTAGSDTYFGYQAGAVTPIASGFNVCVGYQAGSSLVSGTKNCVLGYGAMKSSTQLSNMTVIGSLAAYSDDNKTGVGGSVVIGYKARYATTSGGADTVIGSLAANGAVSGSNSVIIGASALGGPGASISYSNCVVIGYQAMYNAAGTMSNNVAIGTRASYSNTTGSDNVAVGYQALYTNQTGSQNVAVGTEAGKLATGSGNIFYGHQAGTAVTTGSNNTFFGYQAGATVTTGSGNVFIGYQAGGSETTNSDRLYIANSNTSTPLIWGDFSAGQVRINSKLGVAADPGAFTLLVNTDFAYKPTSNLWTISSDVRIKQNIRDLESGADIILRLQPRLFKFIPEYCQKYSIDEDAYNYGFIADEVEQVIPSCVKTTSESLGSIENLKTLNINNIMTALIRHTQELISDCDSIRRRLDILDN